MGDVVQGEVGMRFVRGITALLACCAMVASCGGGKSTATTEGGAAATADLALVLSTTSVKDSGSETVTATVNVVDAARNALSDIPVSFSVDNNAVVVVSSPKTDSSGQIQATVNIGSDKSNRVVTLTATSGSITRTASFAVTGAKITASPHQSVIDPGASGQIDYTVKDANDNPLSGQSITISAPGIAGATGVTDTGGKYTLNYTAPSSNGTLLITASAAGTTSQQTILIQGSGGGSIPPVTAVLSSASVSVNPSVVSANTSGTTSPHTAEIRALFLDKDNSPIQNMRVKFYLRDVNNVGGTISVGTNVAYSDSSGVALATYTPGSRSSPTDGVIIRACYYVNDTEVANADCLNTSNKTPPPDKFVEASLTVSSDPLSVTIGTDNTVADGAGGLTYIKKYVVLVADSSGQPKSDVQITPSVDLVSYMKGWYDGPRAWNRTGPPIAGVTGFTGPTCDNEDQNRNGSLDAGDDFNGNGKLDPRKADVVVSTVGSSKTDANGVAVVQIQYPKSAATWVNFNLMVSATGISGSEGRTAWFGNLPAAASEFLGTASPSFVISPYGTANSCSNPN